MPKENPQIGTCPCPFAGCTETMKVKKFAARSDNPLHTRKAGKLYADCPVHGRFGADGAKATQDYLLEKGDLWDHEEKAQHQAAAAAASQAPAASTHQRPVAPASPTKPAPASNRPAPPASAQPSKKSVWDL